MYISVIGAGEASESELRLAEAVGTEIARRSSILVCGGLGGVMEAAAKGAVEAGGLALGLLPGETRAQANPYLSASIPTGLGHGRNYWVALGGDGVIAVGGGAGTLSEIGLALKLRRPIALLQSLDVEAAGISDPLLKIATNPREAVELVCGARGR